MTFDRFNYLLTNIDPYMGLTKAEKLQGWHFCYYNLGLLINNILVQCPEQERCECLCYSTTL